MKDKKMDSVIDLIWSVEEEPDMTPQAINANCGGGGVSCCACCCSVPNIFTKHLCN